MTSRLDWLPSVEARGCYRDMNTLAAFQTWGNLHPPIGKWTFLLVTILTYSCRFCGTVSNANSSNSWALCGLWRGVLDGF